MENKELSIASTVVDSAHRTIELLKQIPKTGKAGRNIFIKSYNRRPQNKKKTRLLMFKVALNTFMTANQILIIQATPMPRYPNGTQ